jgi:CBS domain-containing protein
MEDAMQIGEIMSPNVQLANPNQSIREIARIMAECDCGAVPVGDNDRLVGIVTDRDIAVRAVAAGKSPDTPVREVMSRGVRCCLPRHTAAEVLREMSSVQIRRLPVVDPSRRLVGIVSLGDIAMADGPQSSGVALCGISEPGGDHSQTSLAMAH